MRTAAAVEPGPDHPTRTWTQAVSAGENTPLAARLHPISGPKHGLPQEAAPAETSDAEVFNRQYAPAADESQKASK